MRARPAFTQLSLIVAVISCSFVFAVSARRCVRVCALHALAVFASVVFWCYPTPACGQGSLAIDSTNDESSWRVLVRITRPDVTRGEREYPQVKLRPGDRWSVDAGGCVQTGGAGATWKRYVDPRGPQSDRYYHGSIAVVDDAPVVHLSTILGHEQVIPVSADPTRLHLRLGYEDDNYGDNGYTNHDDGTENQCLNESDAYVLLTIKRAAAAVRAVAHMTNARITGRADTTSVVGPAFHRTSLESFKVASAAVPTLASVAGASAVRLPVVYRTVEANESAVSQPKFEYETQLEIDSFGLSWRPRQRLFSGIVRLEVVNVDKPRAAPLRLPDRILFQISADGATVNPEDPIIEEANRIQRIEVSTARGDSTLMLHVLPQGLMAPVDLRLRVSLRPLELALNDTMPGFGLGRSEATVGLPTGVDDDSVDVSLIASHGNVSPEHVWVHPGRPAHVIFRSGGLHQGMLSAIAAGSGYGRAQVKAVYSWPTGFLLATLLGVLAGGTAIMAFRKLRWDPATVFQVFGGGLVSGLVAAIGGSLLGVKIVDFEPGAGSGLVAVFFLSVVGAILGEKLFDIISPKTPHS